MPSPFNILSSLQHENCRAAIGKRVNMLLAITSCRNLNEFSHTQDRSINGLIDE